MKSKLFLIYLFSFILGIFIAPFFRIEGDYFLYASFSVFLFLPLFYKTKYLKHIIVSLSIICFAIFHFRLFIPKNDSSWANFYIGKKAEISGIVDSEPSGEKVETFYLKPKNLSVGTYFQNDPRGGVLVTLRKDEVVGFGDKIKIYGVLQGISEGNSSYKDYLTKYQVYSKMDFPEFEKTDFETSFKERNWMLFKRQLFWIKKNFISIIGKILPEPDASLMVGLLLGIKKTLPDWMLMAFKNTGTMHIIALSGFNITVIVAFLKNLTKNLSRRLSFWIPVLAVLFFIIMTGADSSVVRAGIMGLMLILAKKFGRQSDASITFFFAAFLMIFLNPLILRFDLGFQLSFASMAGIIYLAPFVEKLFKKFPAFLSENLSLTFAAQVMTIPIILYNFGIISIISLLANLLILPVVPLAMLFGTISVLSYLIVPFIGEVLGWSGYLLTEYIIKISDFLSKLPYASINYNLPNSYFIAFYYLLLIDGILFMNNFKRRKNA